MNIRKFIAGAAVSALIFAGAVAAVNWANGSATVKPRPGTAVLGQQNDRETKEVAGTNFSTRIPADITIRDHNIKPQGIRIEQMLAVGSRNKPGEQVAITIGTLPSDGLRNISDVQFRIKNIEKYREIAIGEMPDGSLVFQNMTNSEFSIFWENGKKYASVVVSGVPTQRESLDEILTTAVRNWQWK